MGPDGPERKARVLTTGRVRLFCQQGWQRVRRQGLVACDAARDETEWCSCATRRRRDDAARQVRARVLHRHAPQAWDRRVVPGECAPRCKAGCQTDSLYGLVRVQGEVYMQRYVPGSLRWISTYFDGMLNEAIDQSPVSEKPIVWVCPRLHAWSKSSDPVPTVPSDAETIPGDGLLGRLVMWVPPAGDLDTRRDSVGAYFEIQALSARRVLHGFHLLDHGRTAQRCIVFTTDYRCVGRGCACRVGESLGESITRLTPLCYPQVFSAAPVTTVE